MPNKFTINNYAINITYLQRRLDCIIDLYKINTTDFTPLDDNMKQTLSKLNQENLAQVLSQLKQDEIASVLSTESAQVLSQQQPVIQDHIINKYRTNSKTNKTNISGEFIHNRWNDSDIII